MFGSHLHYGLVAWGGTSNGNITKILTLQKKAIRAIKQVDNRTHCKPLFKELHILTLPSLYILQTIIFAKTHSINYNNKFHMYNTRNQNNFNLNQHRLKSTEQDPNYIGAKLFNLLPKTIRDLTSIDKLKSNLKQYLLNLPYYSLQEFIDDHSYRPQR